MQRQQLGQCGEIIAVAWLQRHHMQIVTRNYHNAYGEIDIIAYHNNCLVFVEVRARRSMGFGSALDSIDSRKQQKIVRTAQYFLQQNPHYDHVDLRFDVITLDYSKTDSLTRALTFLACNTMSIDDLVVNFQSIGLNLQWIANADFG